MKVTAAAVVLAPLAVMILPFALDWYHRTVVGETLDTIDSRSAICTTERLSIMDAQSENPSTLQARVFLGEFELLAAALIKQLDAVDVPASERRALLTELFNVRAQINRLQAAYHFPVADRPAKSPQ